MFYNRLLNLLSPHQCSLFIRTWLFCLQSVRVSYKGKAFSFQGFGLYFLRLYKKSYLSVQYLFYPFNYLEVAFNYMQLAFIYLDSAFISMQLVLISLELAFIYKGLFFIYLELALIYMHLALIYTELALISLTISQVFSKDRYPEVDGEFNVNLMNVLPFFKTPLCKLLLLLKFLLSQQQGKRYYPVSYLFSFYFLLLF